MKDYLRKSDDDFEIITEPDNTDALLSGEASSHFPVLHRRRKDDGQDEEVNRLRAILDALDKGEPLPESGIEPPAAALETKYYKQF